MSRYVKRRQLSHLSAAATSEVPVRSLQETFAELLIPSSDTGVYDLATAHGLGTVVYETGFKSGIEAASNARRITLPNSLIDVLAQSRTWIASARRRMPPVGDPPMGSMARWVMRAVKNRNMAVAIGTQMEFLQSKGLLTAELMDAYNGWLDSTQTTMNDLSDLLRRPDVRTAFNAVTTVIGSGADADDAIRILRLPVPRFVPRDAASGLGLHPAIWIGAVIVVLLIIVLGLSIFYAPETIEAEATLADAETRRAIIDEAARRCREGGDCDMLERVIPSVVEAGARPDKFPWGWVLLGVAAVGIGYLAFGKGAAPIRTRIREEAVSARRRFLPEEAPSEAT